MLGLRRLFPGTIILFVASVIHAQAQFQCPPGSTPVSGGGGLMCQCPDGSYAGLYTGCRQQQRTRPQIPLGSTRCGTGYCPAGKKCGSDGKCLPEDAVDCGPQSKIYCNAGSKCSRDGKRCLALDEVDCGSFFCKAGTTCGSAGKCIQHEANPNPFLPKSFNWLGPDSIAGAKGGSVLDPLVSQAASALTSDFMAKLPAKVGTESVRAAVEMTIKNGLTVAIPAGFSAKQRTEAINELTALWKSDLTRANFAPIAGGFAAQAAKGAVVDQSAKLVANFAAAAVAKRTSNQFAIEFSRAATELAIVDAYAAKGGGWQAALLANGAKITEASVGLAHDTHSAAKSMRAYEVQVNDVISRAQRETDPAERARMLKTSINAITTLNDLKNEHPVINTLSNVTVEGTVESLRSWIP
jgi:hypothetical protein